MGQQRCSFLDDAGVRRQFLFHLPDGFSPDSQRWPLLIYLHGGACRNLFERQGRKALLSAGLVVAGTKFAVASPDGHTRGVWDNPESWVLPLVRELCAAKWVDQDRVYLTGLSMGGMAALEFSGQAPHLFAAAASVAGYTRSAARSTVVRGMSSTPTLIVHSRQDRTCPWEEMRLLMQDAEMAGGQAEWQEITGDHEPAFKSAYLDSPTVFEWLLRHNLQDRMMAD